MNSQIKVLSKISSISNKEQERVANQTIQATDEEANLLQTTFNNDSSPTNTREQQQKQQAADLASNFKIKLGREAKTFKLIDERNWNIVPNEPSSETTFFQDGHSAMSIVSVIGPKGVGKSTLLNKLARKQAFKTYRCMPPPPSTSSPSTPPHSGGDRGAKTTKVNLQHVTRGIDIHSTHYRILLDCQPMLASSVLTDFLSGRSSSQFVKGSQIDDPFVSCQAISLQLLTFLIATCDYVIIMVNWLVDVHLLKLISSAIMLIGEDNVRTKFIMFSSDQQIHSKKFKNLVDKLIGDGRVEKFLSDDGELYSHIAPYSNEKCELCHKEPATFTGKNWLSSCQRIWNSTIKNSSMFVDYATQLYNSDYSISPG